MCEASGRADDGGEGARRRVADRRQRCRRRHPVVHVPHLGIALMSEQQLEKGHQILPLFRRCLQARLDFHPMCFGLQPTTDKKTFTRQGK